MQRNFPEITLYSSPISDASARARIGLALKQVPYRLSPISLYNRTNETDEFTNINPARAVPALIIKDLNEEDPKKVEVLVQSNAILEYLDETFPQTAPFFPPFDQPLARAKVRSLLAIIATDIHPLTVPRVTREIPRRFPCPESTAAQENGNKDWVNYWISRGLALFETMASKTAGSYSFGDIVTLADIYLMPQLWTAKRFGVNLEHFPTISRIYKNLMEVEAIRKEEHNPQLEGSGSANSFLGPS